MALKEAKVVPIPDSNGSGDLETPTSSATTGRNKAVMTQCHPLQKHSNTEGLFGFANAEAIKEKVRNSKLAPKPAYNVHNYYKEKGCFADLARNSHFETVTLSVIVINALWIMIDTDWNPAPTIIEATTVFVVMDCLFFSYFSFELFVRFMAFARKCNCLKDAWFVFDSTLVALYAFDPFVLGIVAFASDGKGLNLPTAVLRLFRLARLSRLIRMLRNLPELMVMIKGIVTASASVGYTMGLLLLVTYVFAIALVNVAKGTPTIEQDFFPGVLLAMHNLIIYGTFLDALSDFMPVIMEESTLCFILGWMYICLASLTVMNMLIGVLCEVISATAEEEKESMMVDKVNDTFGDIVRELDRDASGSLSWEEFQKIMDYPNALKALESVNVNAESMVDMAEEYFFDEHGSPVDVPFATFMEMVLDLRGGQQATVKDIMLSGKRSNQRFSDLNKRVDGLEKNISSVDRKLDELLSKFSTQPQVLSAAVAQPKGPKSGTAVYGLMRPRMRRKRWRVIREPTASKGIYI